MYCNDARIYLLATLHILWHLTNNIGISWTCLNVESSESVITDTLHGLAWIALIYKASGFFISTKITRCCVPE